ncbi:MAG: glycoside hydrolase family 43 protein [Gemmatimonadaceae bacterium]|nr:glycoside hydrolase family 43 protein [Gemmatimonadaceae bacterium]
MSAASSGCSSGGTVGSAPVAPTETRQCSFTNPLAPGADPWVTRQDGAYYYVQSRSNAIWVSKATTLSDVVIAAPTRVWSAPGSGWNRTNIWAPELHYIDGRWYIYYAGGASGPPFTTQHAGVLQSQGSDALGPYTDKGMLYTGDSIGTTMGNRWSIDLTTGQIGGQRYAVWSGWRQNAATDRTPQQLYIARMDNPWTISSNRVELSAPTESWERGTELDLQEGPEFLQHGGDVYLVYSTRESWLKDYRLGQLRVRSAIADPLVPANWTKTGPVFLGNATVFGVGHASFTVSPDGAQEWLVYHSKVSTTPGWDRVVRMQPFTWNAAGPLFGDPVPSGATMPRPSGECK